MGEFRFRIPDYWDLESRHARTVHVIGLDGIPKPCNVQELEKTLRVSRNQNESGKIYIAYPFSTRGELTICTGTLPESPNEYNLATELARGTINRLRNQTSIWEEGGLEIPDQVRELTRLAIAKLGSSIVAPVPEKDEFAREALDFGIEAIFNLCEHFGKEISDYRVSENEIPSFWLATTNPQETPEQHALLNSFDLLSTNSVEPLSDQLIDQKFIVGPFLDASPHSSFVTQNEDYQAGRIAVLKHCDEILEALPENTSLIHAACNLNGIGHKNLGYRQQIQLTTAILAKLDDSKCDRPVMVSFDYPWAERMAWSVGGIHPLQIADDLMRNGSRISFIGLDINLDYWPCGSVSRDPLQWIDMIDVWCQLGLPLVVCLRVPQPIVLAENSSGDVEFSSDHDQNVTIAIDSDLTTEQSDAETYVVANSVRENLNQDQRLKLIQTVLPMIVARPGVHGLVWRQWSDSDDRRFPDGGLVNETGIEKATALAIQQLRTETLRR